MKMKTKLFAFLAVALMMALPLAAFIPSADAGIDSNDSIDRIDDIADLQPIDLPEGFENGLEDGDAMLLGDSRATGVLEGMYPGSWTWDSTTGFGPYNSFYGAFDIDNGNAFVGVLDPYNLKKLVDGTDLSADGHFNIMWVLPTVYWSVDENGNLELSNDSTKGIAYAHTIDGHVYKYIAYGVYEGTLNDDGTAPTMLTSESGKLPIVSKTRASFRTLAEANDVSELGTDAYAMQWNFYMWELYKYIGFTAMADFNSQKIVGWGHTHGSTYTFDTGATDNLGPYAGKISASISSTTGDSSVKLYLENAWGGVAEFVDGVVVNGLQGFYIDTKHSPTEATAVETDVIYVEQAMPSQGYPTAISTNANIWGIGTDITGGSSTKGLADYFNTSGTSNRCIYVGGYSYESSSDAVKYGVSYAYVSAKTSSYNYLGSRLAFVFDQDPVTFTPASYDYKLNYDPTLMATTSAAISVDGMDPITHDFPTFTVTIESTDPSMGTIDVSSADIQWGTTVTVEGNTLTIGETVITATPAEGYRLASWSVANGDVITSETTITATFELIPVPEPVENKLLKLIPLIVIIALTVMAAIALMSFTGNGIDLIKLLIGLTVCVLFVAMAMIPAVGGF